MSEIRFKLTAVHAVLAVAAVAILVVVKIASLGETGDPALHDAIRRELMNELGGRIGREIETLDTKDDAAVAAFIDRSQPDAIEVHSVSVSKPLLSFDSSFEAVVRFEYTLSGRPRETAYWRFDHTAMAGWRRPRRTSALFYYLNFV